MIQKENLQQFSKWAGFVGTMTILSGVITTIAGLFAFALGAIPGILTILLGMTLRKAKTAADELLLDSTGASAANLNLLVLNLSKFYKIQGTLIIITYVVAVLALGFVMYAGASSLETFLGNM